MALAMALCFLFAGLTFVRADVLAEVDQSAIDTAAVYIGPLDNFDVNETGIKFTAKIKKTDYYGLTGGVDAIGNNEVHLGVEVSRANADGSYTILPNAHYTVDTAGTLQTYNVGGVELEDYFMYSFSIKYNLERIFGENFDANDATIAKNINFMYADELCIRPFYQVISEVDGAGPRVYGEYGASRSMVHVAMAEYADVNSTLSPEEKELFISKYLSNIEEETAIEVYADGRTNIALDSSIENYTIGTSGKVVAREDGKIDLSALEGFAVGEEFYLYGYTADRRVYPYKATFKGFTGIPTTAVEDEFVLDESGKLYLNNTQFAGQEIESLFYSDGNFLENATITESVGEKIANGLVTRIDGTYYKLNNVLYVTKAFENTRESRLDMVETFSGQNRSHTSFYSIATDNTREVTGYYVLVENITFDLSNIDQILGEENKMDEATFVAEGRDAGRENEMFSNNRTGRNITFNATFDGRGYSMDNITLLDASSSMFGRTTNGSTIKNVAFNSFNGRARKKVTAEDGTAYYYYTVSGASQTGKIFNDSVSASDKVTIENVYINDNNANDNGSYGGLFYYESYEENAGSAYPVVPVTFKNVIIINAEGPLFASKGFSAVGDDDSITDTYYVSSENIAWSHPTATSNSRGENFIKVSALPKEGSTIDFYGADKVINYSTFSSEYWTIVNGVPVWNTASVVSTLKDGETAVTAIDSNEAGKEYKVEIVAYGKAGDVSKISVSGAENLVDYANGIITVKQFVSGEATLTVSYDGAVVTTYAVSVDTLPVATLTGSAGVVDAIDSSISGEKYTITAMAGGKDVTSQIELAVSGDDIVTISDNVIEIKQNVEGTATVTATVGGVEFTYSVKVDTSVAEPINEEIFFSAYDGFLHFKGTALDGAELSSVKYDGVELLDAEGNVNASAITGKTAGDVIALSIKTSLGKYELSNVKYYDGAFGQDNKTALVDLLNTYTGTLTGTYILVENITFDPESTDDLFRPETAVSTNVFNATFDGRGYTLNNLSFLKGYGIFGTLPGPKALLKNFAINRIFATTSASVTPTEKGISYVSVLFGGSNKPEIAAVDPAVNILTMENVYIYRYVETSSRYDWIINYNESGTIILNNVIIEIEQNNALDNTVAGSGQGILGTSNTIGSATNTFFTNGAGASNWTVALPGIVQYNAYDMTVEARREVLAAKTEMKESLNTFSSDYWTIVDGYPRFKSCTDWVTVTNSESEEVTAIGELGNYNVNLFVDGIASADLSAITVEDDSDFITYNNGVITVAGEGQKYEATITVKYNGVENLTIAVEVDDRKAQPNAEEILISKANNKIYFNGTTLEGAEIESILYNGTPVYENGVIDTSLIPTEVNTAFTLELSTANAKYELRNVKLYDGVYAQENVTELITTFNYTGTLTGYYVLAENITFDPSVSAQRFACNADRQYNATFDGRGYTMNNLAISGTSKYGAFGTYPGADAVIKNVAINRIFVGANETATSFNSMLFGGKGAVAGESIITFENVYIYRYLSSCATSRDYLFYYTDAGSNITWNMNNVIIEYHQDDSIASADRASMMMKTAATLGTQTNTYITSGATSAGVALTGVVQYNKVDTLENRRVELAKLITDISAFSSEYWTIVDGYPMWNTTIDRVVLEDDAEEVNVTEISKPGSYTAKIIDKDKNVITEGLTITCDNENVTTNGNVITVNEGFYKTNITIAKGDVTATFAVSIDTRVADVIPAEKEILLSKLDNYIYVKGTALEEKKIISAVYGATELVVDGALDLSKLDVAVNTQIALRVETEDGGLYEVENAKLYDAVFYNDPVSRKAMVDLFSAGDRTTSGSSSAFDKETLTGYYVLAENLTFSAYAEDGVTVSVAEAFSNNGSSYGSNTLKGTFDGRGYTLNNVIIYESQTAGGMFGIAGDGATLKNFAINGLAMVTGKASTGYTYAGAAGNYSLFFYKPETADSKITFENIYLNRDITSKTSYNGVFFNEGIATETVYTDYVYVTDEGSTTYKVEYTYYSFGQLTFNNVIVENKTSTSPIFTGGRAIAYQVEWDEASQKYVRVKNASNKDVGAYTYSFYGSQAPATSNVDAEGNVIIKGYSSDSIYSDAIVKDTDSISNTYFITTGKFGRDAVAPAANANGDAFKLYASEAKMIEANNDYTSFSSAYWTVAEGGIPTWKTLPVEEVPAE